MSEWIRATAVLFQMHLATVARSRRMIIGLGLAGMAPFFTMLGIRFGPDREAAELACAVGVNFNLQVVVPLLALIAGSAVVNEEVEKRTVTYLFTRPIPRAALLFGRWLATLVFVSVLLCASAWLVTRVAAQHGALPAGIPGRLVAASFAGGAVYSALFAVIGVFLKRPMIVGLAYTFAFEVLIANVPGEIQSLSIQHYLRSIAIDPAVDAWKIVDLSRFVALDTPMEATGTLASLLLIALTAGAIGISRRQYVLTS